MRRIRRIIVVLLLILIIAAPCYAVNIVDTIMCKKVILCVTRMAILVNRVTGEVKYMRSSRGQWVPFSRIQKVQCQALYNAQFASGRKCHER